jgi:CheY-like chemotaxis protein
MTEQRAMRAIDILVVADDPSEVRLLQEVLTAGKITNQLRVVPDGGAALIVGHQQGPDADRAGPDLILDLILFDVHRSTPDGRDLLASLARDPELQAVPVVVLTASAEEQALLQAQARDGTSYLPKPVDVAQFLTVVNKIAGFHLSIVSGASASSELAQEDLPIPTTPSLLAGDHGVARLSNVLMS